VFARSFLPARWFSSVRKASPELACCEVFAFFDGGSEGAAPASACLARVRFAVLMVEYYIEWSVVCYWDFDALQLR
jgi:hypothetical protein